MSKRVLAHSRSHSHSCQLVRITLKYKIGKSKYFHWQFAYNTLSRICTRIECVLVHTIPANYAHFLFATHNRNIQRIEKKKQQQQQQKQQQQQQTPNLNKHNK